MKLDEHTEVFVDKLAIRKNIMTLGVLVKNTSGKPESVETKLAVRFQNSSESRILPLPITDTSFDEQDNYIGYAVFDYELDTIFAKQDLNEFFVFVQAYSNGRYEDVLIENSDFNQVKDENEYACLVEQQKIVIRRKKKLKPYPDNWLISLLCSIYRVIEFVIGTLLIPLFLLDGIYVIQLGKRRRLLEETYGGSQLKRTILYAKWRYSSFCRWTINLATLKRMILNLTASFLSLFCKKDSVLFVSSRRNDITGNIAFVNDALQEKNVKVLFWLEPGKTKFVKVSKVLSLAHKIAKSKVIIVDDYTPILNDIWALKHCKLIQLWHACGAFKTFGFSRLGKDGGPNQTTRNHRNYDYVMVSSAEIARFYAEGFGVDEKNVKALGIPRTDVFFQEEYKTEIRRKIYEQYPMLKGKKVILFAPTFRGNGAGSAYYPFEKLDAAALLETLGDDYVLIIKHHPFIAQKHPFDERVSNRVLDLSKESEINDLLFVTDLLITDYSSVIFEASLLNIPMLFYAFDLEEYVVNRDFYYPFKGFVPGKIVRSQNGIIEAIRKEEYQQDKIDNFKRRFFDDLDGRASQRVADFVLSLLHK
jgi:CDP-glycerol glycerophosphotransferase (TagB/SpsB family)